MWAYFYVSVVHFKNRRDSGHRVLPMISSLVRC